MNRLQNSLGPTGKSRWGMVPRKAFTLSSVVLLVGLIGILGAIPASAQGTPTVMSRSTSLGTIITDGAGKTLYTFAGDTAGTFGCTAACLTAWPPLLLPAGQPVVAPGLGGTFGVVTRPEGRQVTYNGMPLYNFNRDAAPGDVLGNGSMGFGALWSVNMAVSAVSLPRTGGPVVAPVLASLAMVLAGVGVASRRFLRARHTA